MELRQMILNVALIVGVLLGVLGITVALVYNSHLDNARRQAQHIKDDQVTTACIEAGNQWINDNCIWLPRSAKVSP